MSRVPVTRALVLAVTVAAAAALPAAARAPRPPTVDIHTLGLMAPDARSVSVQVLASCEDRATVVEASVAVSQSSGSGRAVFPLTCVGYVQPFTVVVPVQSGTFSLGAAD